MILSEFHTSAAEIDQLPLTNLTRKGIPNNLVWEDEHQRIFEGFFGEYTYFAIIVSEYRFHT